MLSRVWSAAVRGVDAFPVRVELDLANGLPSFTTVGLPDHSVRESRDRVVSALRNSGFDFPSRRVTVNLAPAQWRKVGTHLDLPISLGLLAASGQLKDGDWSGELSFFGELALDGSVRPVSGILAMAMSAKAEGLRAVVVPRSNRIEAAATGITAYGIGSLKEAVELIKGARPAEDPARADEALRCPEAPDLGDVKGQALAKRALEIAAAGGHNLLMVGPPGTGKSMLARRLPGILPALSEEESVEVTKIHSVAGYLPPGSGLMRWRPFRAPHTSATTPALVGGGACCRPGEISLAHRGVLFLDELPEFPRAALEALRQPLEDRCVAVARLKETVTYPADFMLVAAMNPCPCGYHGSRTAACRCPESAVERYRSRISGPFLDRMDLEVELAALPFRDWAQNGPGPRPGAECSSSVRARVLAARALAAERNQGLPNARLAAARLKQACGLDASAMGLLEHAAAKGLSPRALDRLVRVSRTIADLAGRDIIGKEQVAEALMYRTGDSCGGT
ncbi:MAG: YifB family Mg chelatase-like AAA ATPase [Elusimicrobiota bacterium]